MADQLRAFFLSFCPQRAPAALKAALVATALGLSSLGGSLPAVAQAVPATATSDLRWSHLAPIQLAAMGPEIVVNYIPPRHEPFVDHLMPFSPEYAIRNWVQDRIRCTGIGTQTVRVVIEDASVIEVPLNPKGGIAGFFTDEPEARYEAKAVVVIQLLDSGGQPLIEVRQSAWRSKTLNEKASIEDRDRVWYQLVEGLMTDLNGALDSGIRTAFTDSLLR